jgi:hypothetical protein
VGPLDEEPPDEPVDEEPPDEPELPRPLPTPQPANTVMIKLKIRPVDTNLYFRVSLFRDIQPSSIDFCGDLMIVFIAKISLKLWPFIGHSGSIVALQHGGRE